MSCRRPWRRRRKQKNAPGLRIAVDRFRLRSVAVHACGNVRGVWQSSRVSRTRIMPRAFRGSHRWRSTARRPTTVNAWQTKNRRVQASRRRRSRRRARRFYTYASTEVNRAYVTEDGDEVASYIPLLPRNTDEVRATELYTDTVWPTSAIDARRICITERVAPTIRRGRHAGWPRLLLMTGRTNAIDAILVFRRSVPLRLLRLLSKTALSTTLIDSKRLWKTTSNAATKNSNLSVRPRMRPTVRAMRLTRPLKRFPASARVSPHLAATAWSPLQFRVTLPAPINLTPRLRGSQAWRSRCYLCRGAGAR